MGTAESIRVLLGCVLLTGATPGCGTVVKEDEADAVSEGTGDASATMDAMLAQADAHPAGDANGADSEPDAFVPECEPDTTLCVQGQVIVCTGDGTIASSQECVLGCHDSGERCNALDPSNGLAFFPRPSEYSAGSACRR